MKRSSVLARPKSDLDSHPLAAPTTCCIPRNGTISGNSLAAAHACHSGAAIKVIWKLPAGSTGSVCAVRVLFQFILILFYFFLFCLPKRLNVRISPKAKYEREPFFFSLFLDQRSINANAPRGFRFRWSRLPVIVWLLELLLPLLLLLLLMVLQRSIIERVPYANLPDTYMQLKIIKCNLVLPFQPK